MYLSKKIKSVQDSLCLSFDIIPILFSDPALFKIIEFNVKANGEKKTRLVRSPTSGLSFQVEVQEDFRQNLANFT